MGTGVNNLKTYGRWAFKELRDAFAMEEEYQKLIASFLTLAKEVV